MYTASAVAPNAPASKCGLCLLSTCIASIGLFGSLNPGSFSLDFPAFLLWYPGF